MILILDTITSNIPHVTVPFIISVEAIYFMQLINKTS